MCHAGSGTTLAALTSGLPLVLVPQGADQFVNAAACEKAGVARVIGPDGMSSAAVRDAVVGVLRPGSPEQDVARRIGAEIAAMPSAAEVAQHLEQLARS